jgi:hypothetical protein
VNSVSNHRIASLLLLLLSLATLVSQGGLVAAPPAPAVPLSEALPVVEKLGVALRVTERPAWPKPPGAAVTVTLRPMVEAPGTHVVSFGLPFGPGVIEDDRRIRVLGPDGQEVPVFTRPLVHWWIDRKQGTPRSVLVQFEMAFPDRSPRLVTLTWDRPRTRSRAAMVPVAETQVATRVEFPAADRVAMSYEYRRPKVLALLPPEWLCTSLVTWQQTPSRQNTVAPWYDRHLVEQFEGSLRQISAKGFDAHLFDRPATYVRVYARHGDERYLLAALQAGDFYIQRLGPDGFFDLKPEKDHKYVYTEGAALLYMLTGDERYRAAIDRALKAWESHMRIEYTGTGFWTERHHGFGMAAYLHAYEVTGEPKHLDTARRYFDAAFAMQIRPVDGKEPDGAWAHSSASHGEGSGWVTSPWMSAFLADSIWKYWMLAGDARCPASLALYASFLAKHAVAPDGKAVFYMASSPARGQSRNPEQGAHNMEGAYLLAMGYYLSGGTDEGLRGKIETLWPPIMEDGANAPARKFTWRFRETSMLVWFLTEARGRTREGG